MREGIIADVLVVDPYDPMRRMLRLVLSDAGYAVAEATTYPAALLHLRAAGPTVVVSANAAADFRAEEDFFRLVARDPALAGRHRFVLVTTIAEWLPPALDATLSDLGVRVLNLPYDEHALLAAVAAAAGRERARDDDEATG